ncbi:hypothetical protein MSP8886_02739 [Marinomonas spartinae]|uniref:Oxidoreductase molybdopterin binding domain protein n=2 Tax=Marinomonas spartinae TaxID=1792290 RepID=A0A1A8TLM5_9GAMM|nr:hypothetical protein MSP8886_02739 [Marinomonas spartinae]
MVKVRCYQKLILNNKNINKFYITLLSLFTMITILSSPSVNAMTVNATFEPPSKDTTPVLELGPPEHTTILSIADIESLPIYKTDNIEHFDGPSGQFYGVWLNDLLEKYHLKDAPRLRFTALDGYEVFIDKSSRQKRQYFLATRLNNLPITTDNLGPLMLLIPYDLDLPITQAASKSRWIWALHTIIAQ